ncbi:MAG: hypothetical protein WAK93_19490 [Solirubrobacteraceae bacterium]
MLRGLALLLLHQATHDGVRNRLGIHPILAATDLVLDLDETHVARLSFPYFRCPDQLKFRFDTLMYYPQQFGGVWTFG